MAVNVRDPLFIALYGPATVETVTKSSAFAAEAFLGYTRTGALPALAGNYVAGICTKSTLAFDNRMPIACIGYAIVRVKPGAVIALDGAVSIDTTGEAIPATTGYVVGRALDSSTGTGTALIPHYIAIRLT